MHASITAIGSDGFPGLASALTFDSSFLAAEHSGVMSLCLGSIIVDLVDASVVGGEDIRGKPSNTAVMAAAGIRG